MSLENKQEFAVIIRVEKANPNGDPANNNQPRTDYENHGEISAECTKRKVRDRLQEEGHPIFVQSDEKKIDGMPSLEARAKSSEHGLGKDAFNATKTNSEEAIKMACEKWVDVRAFGQVFAFSKDETSAHGVSIGIHGPVTIRPSVSVEPISTTDIQITKSVNGEGDGTKKSSDTMGKKPRVEKAVYVTYGNICPQLSERTGFSNEDAEAIKEILPRLYEGDASSARPAGSMSVLKVIWWKHNSKRGACSTYRVHNSLTVHKDGTYDLEPIEGVEVEEIDGF